MTAKTLFEHIGNKDIDDMAGWQRKVINIWMDKE